MTIEVDWEYYNSHFPKLSEDDFNRYIYQATRIVLRRVDESLYDEEKETDVKDCICCVLNKLYEIEVSDNVSSVSNGGYSKSFVTSTKDEQDQSLEDILDEWLGFIRKSKWVAF